LEYDASRLTSEVVMPDDMVCVLAIDGGGIRGIIPARVLEEIEDRTGRPASGLFDLICGTSTGGIVACGLARGIAAGRLGDLYAEQGGAIFSRSLWHKIVTLWGWIGPKYRPAPLEAMLKSVLADDVWLSDVADVELLVPSYCITLPRPTDLDDDGIASTRTPMFFKSWKARGQGLAKGETAAEFDFPLWQVARATSAAETYFPPAVIGNRPGDAYIMTDGGTFADVPSLCAWVAARQLFPRASRIVIVSLGTGWLEDPIDGRAAAHWGDLAWLHPVLSILMDGQADATVYMLDQIFGADHFRFDASLGTDPKLPYTVYEAFDDASAGNIRRIEALAARIVEQSGDRLTELCRLLGAHAAP
jgi:uncharacterized protein